MKFLMILAMCQMAIAEDRMRRETVALTILAEARGEGEGGMYRVACVIQQRSIERKISPDKVCKQPEQFAKGERWMLGSPSAQYATRLADHLMRGHRFQREVVGFANHFCTLRSEPFWISGRKPTAIHKNHRFYRLQ